MEDAKEIEKARQGRVTSLRDELRGKILENPRDSIITLHKDEEGRFHSGSLASNGHTYLADEGKDSVDKLVVSLDGEGNPDIQNVPQDDINRDEFLEALDGLTGEADAGLFRDGERVDVGEDIGSPLQERYTINAKTIETYQNDHQPLEELKEFLRSVVQSEPEGVSVSRDQEKATGAFLANQGVMVMAREGEEGLSVVGGSEELEKRLAALPEPQARRIFLRAVDELAEEAGKKIQEPRPGGGERYILTAEVEKEEGTPVHENVWHHRHMPDEKELEFAEDEQEKEEEPFLV